MLLDCAIVTRGAKNHTIRTQRLINLATQEHFGASIIPAAIALLTPSHILLRLFPANNSGTTPAPVEMAVTQPYHHTHAGLARVQ